ncbi:MAG: hypothetical protein ACPIOQ_32095 [Promethearchaeia archaeon]
MAATQRTHARAEELITALRQRHRHTALDGTERAEPAARSTIGACTQAHYRERAAMRAHGSCPVDAGW